MRNYIILSLLIIVLFISSVHANNETIVYLKWHQQISLIESDVGIVRTGQADLDALLVQYGIEKLKFLVRKPMTPDPVGLNRVIKLDIPPNRNPQAVIDALEQLRGCEYAVEAPVRYTDDSKYDEVVRGVDSVPNDPFYPDQYMFPLMNAPAAWNLTQGQPSVVIAIVDNGTDWEHPDLDGNIWENSGEVPNNNQDDDDNGFIDDIRGWDFQDDDNNPAPLNDDYHGTHTAGLAAAEMDNYTGVVGMAPGCKIMVVRAGEGSSIYDGIDGILYAAQSGADVISLSWGGPTSNPLEQDIISSTIAQGIVIVAAAGNEGSNQEHYPAAYDGVVAVANTNSNDVLYSESNYGDWISVCAPGVYCLSTVPDSYGAATGTSMSTPLVAGVAALIKSYHPDWDAERIRSQILFTADDIDTKNPSKSGLLGSGRVNAYRAVAEDAPGIQLVAMDITETSGDFDGKLDPGETAVAVVTLKNEGETAHDVEVTLSSNDNDLLQVTSGVWTIPTFTSGVTINNASDPFEISIPQNATTNSEVELLLSFEAGNFYSAEITTSIWIAPAFGDHDVGNVIFTVTEFGAFGYYDKYLNVSRGSGFRYPPTESNALYHGSLVIGTSEDHVSDCAYGEDDWPYQYDFTTLPDGELQFSSSAVVDQMAEASYNDSESASSIGVEVHQTSYAWSDSPDDDYVILSFEVTNTTVATLENLYVGLFMDWDVQVYSVNEADWDAARALGYVYNGQQLPPNPNYYGTSMISPEPVSYRVVSQYVDLLDAEKYQYMSGGFVQTSSSGPNDQATLLSAGPYSIQAGSTVEVVFAVLGGDDLADLQANADAAEAKWSQINTQNPAFSPEPSGKFKITGVYPRPSNDTVRLSFYLPAPGEVQLDAIDLLGRTIPLQRLNYHTAGEKILSISQWSGASGIYFVRATSPFGIAVTKILWLK